MRFSKHLKELREQSGLTMRELAVLCGVSKSAIGMYESGERRPKYEALAALAKIFKVDITSLISLCTDESETDFERSKEKMSRKNLTDEEVEREIERLTKSEAVRLARYEERLRYKRRSYLYKLRDLENRGKALMAAGITEEVLRGGMTLEEVTGDESDE